MGSDLGKLVCDSAGSSVAGGPRLASVNLQGPLSVTTVTSCPHGSQSCPAWGVPALKPTFLSAMLGLWLLYPFLTPRPGLPQASVREVM